MEKNKGGGGQHKLTVIPNLKNRMVKLGVFIEQLAILAGVSKDTVFRARKGERIHLYLASCIVIALESGGTK
jgi:hypothetical protein